MQNAIIDESIIQAKLIWLSEDFRLHGPGIHSTLNVRNHPEISAPRALHSEITVLIRLNPRLILNKSIPPWLPLSLRFSTARNELRTETDTLHASRFSSAPSRYDR